MEFLRSCTTNVHIISSDAIEYSLYRSADTDEHSGGEDCMEVDAVPGDTATLITKLERAGNLVITSQEGGVPKLWVFRLHKDQIEKLDDAQWALERQDRISPTSLADLPDTIDPDDLESDTRANFHFYNALAAFIQGELAAICNPSAIGCLTWILTPKCDGSGSKRSRSMKSDDNSILSMFLKVTAAGAIACLPRISRTSFTSISQLRLQDSQLTVPANDTVLLSPFNIPASFICQLSPEDDGPWLSAASTWFKARYSFLRSAQLASSEDWVAVKPLSDMMGDRSTVDGDTSGPIIWPACLCLHSADRSDHLPNYSVSMGLEAPGFVDPLRKAEEWYLAKTERDALLESQKTGDLSHFDLAPTEDDFDPASSPLYLRAVDSNATLVYPTPPDGILHMHNRPNLPPTNNIGDRADDDELMQTASQENNTSEHHTFADGVDEESDDLFGDMDEDMFGHPDVTDADFNFFDESAAAKAHMLRQLGRENSGGNSDLSAMVPHSDHEPGDGMLGVVPTDHGDSTSKMDNTDQELHDAKVIASVPESPAESDGPEYQAVVATPPLSPTLVKDRLFERYASPTVDNSTNDYRRFKPLPFKDRTVDGKYANGGKFSNGPKEHLAPATLSGSKRSISLREYLDQSHARDRKSPQNGVTRLNRNKFLAHDSDDSETESTVTVLQDNTRRTKPRMSSDDVVDTVREDDHSVTRTTTWRQHILSRLDQTENVADSFEDVWVTSTLSDCWDHLDSIGRHSLPDRRTSYFTSLWDMFDFDSRDLIEIAQLVVANSGRWHAGEHKQEDGTDTLGTTGLEKEHCSHSITTLSSSKLVTLANLAGMSTPTQAARPTPAPKRPLVLAGSSPFGQQLTPINAPFVSLRRADAAWEMLSSATSYWEALGLEPTHGVKDVISDVVIVGSDDFRDSCLVYIDDLRYFYEACKLGQHSSGPRIHRKAPMPQVGSPSDTPMQLYLTALKDCFQELSKKVNQRTRLNSSQSSIVYLFSPWRDPNMNKYLCACYRLFCKDLAGASKNTILHIVSAEQVLGQDDVTLPKSQALVQTALSIYDKVAVDRRDGAEAAWRIWSTPSISLVSPIPRKINFGLSETPPTNLMHEAQVLHLAYGISIDGRWLVAAWTDYAGNHQTTCSFCLYQTNFQDVLMKVRDYTQSLMPSSTSWRLIVGYAGHTGPFDRQTWLNMAAPHIAVTVLEVCQSSPTQIYHTPDPSDPPAPVASTPVIPQTASLTPVSTPGPASMMSPDAPPPTPGSADHATAPEADPDAHLVDPADESFCLVLPFSAVLPRHPSAHPSPRVFASGMLLKRGAGAAGSPLPTLGVDIVGLAGPRPAQGQQPFMPARPAEYVLREVLSWYRGLGLLGKLRGVRGCETGAVPWHLGMVMQGALALEGFFN